MLRVKLPLGTGSVEEVGAEMKLRLENPIPGGVVLKELVLVAMLVLETGTVDWTGNLDSEGLDELRATLGEVGEFNDGLS